MRLLLDINIYLDVALERPGMHATIQVISACGREHEAWLAWHSVATIAYLVERQHSAGRARDFVRSLLTWSDVAVTQRSDVQQALDWDMPDFEDALQAAAAQACQAQVILTRNVRDFRKSPVPAMTPEKFIEDYMPPPADVAGRRVKPKPRRAS